MINNHAITRKAFKALDLNTIYHHFFLINITFKKKSTLNLRQPFSARSIYCAQVRYVLHHV